MSEKKFLVEEVRAQPTSIPSNVTIKLSPEEKGFYEDVGFLTAMYMTILGNYSQTGHFGGPLAYTPANVLIHLAGPENGGLRYDIRNPKHPLSDKFLLAGGHCIPTCYGLWTVLYEALEKEHEATGNDQLRCDPRVAFYGVDALGFRRSPGAVKTLLRDNNLLDHPLFAQAKKRGIRALMGHSESTDATNDVNGGPSGVAVAMSAGKALFWDFLGAPPDTVKVMAFEGEFAFTEGHAQELKSIALSQKVGKRLRLFFSDNNAGIDDSLLGGVIDEKYRAQYNLPLQFSSYGWHVLPVEKGNDYEELLAVFKRMEEVPSSDRRPLVVMAKTVKGWWPTALDGKIGSEKQVVGFSSHPYGFKLNHPYFLALAKSFEDKYGVRFSGLEAAPTNERDRLLHFKTNIDVVLSVLDRRPQLRKWLVSRLLHVASSLSQPLYAELKLSATNPFKDQRLTLPHLPVAPFSYSLTHPTTGKELKGKIVLFEEPGKKWGARRAISEVGKWLNFVTGNRFLTIAADLSNSINLEGCHLLGHYDAERNPRGTRLKGAIQEAGNAATAVGLVSQTLSSRAEEHVGLWAATGTYGAFTPLMYLPLRSFAQQVQDSPFRMGVVTIVAGHSGPETAADARSHFGIFSPQVWNLFPKNHIINLHCWDYNDVAPAYFAAAQMALEKKIGIIVLHVARPDNAVADRKTFADTDLKAAAKGLYLIREFDPSKPKLGTVFLQGASSTINAVSLLPQLASQSINVRLVSVISEELFSQQSKDYQDFIIPQSSRYDSMYVSTGSKRFPPVYGLGPLASEYSLTPDFDDHWRTGGSESDIIKEARMDADSIFSCISRFAAAHDERLKLQEKLLAQAKL